MDTQSDWIAPVLGVPIPCGSEKSQAKQRKAERERRKRMGELEVR